MRMLVLEGVGVVIPDHAIAQIEATEVDQPAPWLLSLLHRADAPTRVRRRLRLRNGGGVEVPADMRMVDGVEILALPGLLAPIGRSVGVIGLAEFADDLLLVCDPNLFTEAGGRTA